MLPNHAPLVSAEQFVTLAHLFPGRIDLGLGRAPGTDPLTVRALRTAADAAHHFPQDVMALRHFFAPAQPGQRVVAVPAAGAERGGWPGDRPPPPSARTPGLPRRRTGGGAAGRGVVAREASRA